MRLQYFPKPNSRIEKLNDFLMNHDSPESNVFKTNHGNQRYFHGNGENFESFSNSRSSSGNRLQHSKDSNQPWSLLEDTGFHNEDDNRKMKSLLHSPRSHHTLALNEQTDNFLAERKPVLLVNPEFRSKSPGNPDRKTDTFLYAIDETDYFGNPSEIEDSLEEISNFQLENGCGKHFVTGL